MSGFGEIAKVTPLLLERAIPAVESAAAKLFADGSAPARSIGSTARLLDSGVSKVERTTAAEDLLSTGKITLKDRKVLDGRNPPDLRSGFIDVDGGPAHQVIVRRFADSNRVGKELAAYGLHKISPFDHTFPTTVVRQDELGQNVLVQERIGRSIADRASMLARREGSGGLETVFNRLLKANDEFATQVDHVAVERAMFGDTDTHLGNVVFSTAKGQIAVGSVDMGQAFTNLRRPYYPRISVLEGKPLSEPTLGKIEEFLDVLRSRQTKPLFDELGLTKTNRATIVSRGRWMLNNGRLPSFTDL